MSLSKTVSEKLFQEAKFKRATSSRNIRMKQKQNKKLAEVKKISDKSQIILVEKGWRKVEGVLEGFEGEIDIGRSIEVLYEMKVFNKLKSVQQLQELETVEICDRMEEEIKFVYLMWEAIPFEELDHDEFKTLLKWLFSQGFHVSKIKKPNFLKKSVTKQMIHTWNKLNFDIRLYESKPINKLYSQPLQQIINSPTNPKSPQQQQIMNKNLKQIYPQWMSIQIEQSQQNKRSKRQTNNVVNRLYRPECYEERQQIRIQKQQEKIEQQLEKCTFKPLINYVVPSYPESTQRPVKGYYKTIDRLRQANQKHLIDKKTKQHIPCGQNYQKLRNQPFKPPKFLNRKKTSISPVILSLQLQICKKKIPIIVKLDDTPQSVATDICRIYSFNSQIHQQILSVIISQLNKKK